MQGEFRQILRDQRDQTGVVRPRRYLAEPDLFALDEQFDPEDATPAQRIGDRQRDALRLGQRRRCHGLRLPGLLIVAFLLAMPYRLAEAGSAGMTHRQQSDLVIEIDEAFDDDPPATGAATGLRIFPGRIDVRVAAQHRLPLARGTHYRLDQAREAQRHGGGAALVQRVGKAIG